MLLSGAFIVTDKVSECYVPNPNFPLILVVFILQFCIAQ